MMDTSGSATRVGSGSELRRVLSLRDLVFYGVVLIQPIAAVPLFGIADRLSRGHVVTTILIAMVAMMITAVSYGRMATVYPTAGSAYTYVGRELNPNLGFLTGWAMMLDYLLIPIINTIYGSVSLGRIMPAIPYAGWATLFSVLITWLNLRGVRSTARTNSLLLFAMCSVIATFMILAVRYLFNLNGMNALFSIQPFYTRGTTDLHSIATATSLAALTYIGFDGVTTLSEEARDPQKNILRATVLVCFVTGVFSGIQVYLAQRVWPDYTTFSHIDTAFMDVSRRVGGAGLFGAMALTLILASIGSGLAGQAGAARLLFGMGRDQALPKKLFAHLDKKHSVPTYNIWGIGLITLVGALFLNYERAAELLNFGAFLAFMGVNLAAARHFYFGGSMRLRRRLFRDLLLPGSGFLFCLFIWWSLPAPAKIVGGSWFVIGICYWAILTRGSRIRPVAIHFEES